MFKEQIYFARKGITDFWNNHFAKAKYYQQQGAAENVVEYQQYRDKLRIGALLAFAALVTLIMMGASLVVMWLLVFGLLNMAVFNKFSFNMIRSFADDIADLPNNLDISSSVEYQVAGKDDKNCLVTLSYTVSEGAIAALNKEQQCDFKKLFTDALKTTVDANQANIAVELGDDLVFLDTALTQALADQQIPGDVEIDWSLEVQEATPLTVVGGSDSDATDDAASTAQKADQDDSAKAGKTAKKKDSEAA